MAENDHVALIVFGASQRADDAMLLARLREGGLDVITASIAEALEVAARSRPDIILLALARAAGEGCRLCREISGDARLARVPVVFVAANGSRDGALEALESGAVDFVAWPEQEAELIERVRVHARLHRAWRRAASRADAAGAALFDAVLEIDRRGRIHEFEPGRLAASWPRFGDGARAQLLSDVFPESLAQSVADAIRRSVGTEGRSLAPCCLSAQGDSLWVELSISEVATASPEGRFFLFLRDVTERLLAEEQRLLLERKLCGEEKMASLARLAGGVSNDIRNVLGAIMSFATGLRAEIDEDSACREVLEHITEACWRGADLASELATIAGETHAEKQRVSVNEAIVEVCDLLARALPTRVIVETELCAGRADIRGIPAQVSQVLTNLALRAVDAMKGEGRLTFSTEERALRAAEIEAHPDLAPGEYVVLRVADTGEGMDPVAAEHVFEPYRSAGSTAEGAGLDMPMVYGLVRNHRGELVLDSELGRGTTVTVYLPALETMAGIAARAPAPEEATAPGGDKVMVVDDETLIRESCKRLLERLGYEAILAGSGAEAVETYRQRGAEIGLVILDLVMPGLSGRETFDKLCALDPNAQVLVSSGYAGEGAVEALLAQGAVGFLSKPFGLDGLKAALAKTSLER